MKKLIALTVTVLALFVSMSVAYGKDNGNGNGNSNGNPAQLFIGDPPNSETYVYSGEVQPIYDTSFGVLLNGAGHPALESLMLIVGIPNSTVAPSDIISISNSSRIDFPDPDLPVEAMSATSINLSLLNNMMSSGDVYEFLGRGDSANNSNSFNNWAAADLAVWGIDVDYFGIFVYTFTPEYLIAGGETLDVTFESGMPLGTFVVAYGEDGDSKSYSTPFTEAGMVVPEPGSLLLLGTGLLGLALFGRRPGGRES